MSTEPTGPGVPAEPSGQRRVVVGTDGSRGARSALLWAADEAALRNCTLLIVYAPHVDTRIIDKLGEPLLHAVDEFGRNLLDQARTEAEERQPRLSVNTVLTSGSAAEALVEFSEGAELVAVGSRGSDEATGSLLGSVSHRVATHAHCPVAVVPAELTPPEPSDAVVAGVTESHAGRKAAQVAAAEAQLRGLPLRLIHGCDRPEADTRIDAVADEIRRAFPRLQLDIESAAGDPVEVLLAASRRARTLVLGCHRSADRWSTRLGPVPSQLIHRVGCPVLLVGS